MAVTAARVRVLIVDDRPLVVAGLREVLGEDASIEVVGAAVTATEAIHVARLEHPDVIFLDVRLAHDTGLGLITEMRTACPLAECLVLAVSDDAESFRDALDRGAHGYLLDDASGDEIRAAVQRVAAGKSHIDPAVSGYLVQTRRRRHDSAEPTLTSREVDVLRLAAQGLTNDAIAESLNVKTETVKTHLSRAFERLGARDRANAVAICMRRGLF
jgi:DNA-binding NarL/FixJ family response regulator